DKQLVDPRLIRNTALDEIEMSPLLRNKLAKLDKELAQNASRTGAAASQSAQTEAELAWLRKARHGKVARGEVSEGMLARLPQQANRSALRKQLRQRSAGPSRNRADDAPAPTAQQQDFLAARREALLASMRDNVERNVQVGAGPQASASDAAQDLLRQQ